MIKGTPISSPIVSNNGNPTHYDKFGVGGYREVSTKIDMYNLSSTLLKVGCLVYVEAEDKIYKYKGDSQWEELKFKDNTSVKAKSYRLSLRAASANNTVVLTDVDDNTETTANIPVASMTNLGEVKLGYQTDNTNKNYAVQLDENNRAYVNVPWTSGTEGGGVGHISQFTSFAFIRSKTKPSTPSGGTYENPIPNGWSDGIPEGTDPVWFSTRVFNSDDSIAGGWSTPTLLTDTASMDVCYSNSNTRPDAPTTHGIQNNSVWHNDAQIDDIWMAISTRTSITENWSNWEIFRIKGEKGEDGTSIKVVGTYNNSGCELSINSNTKEVSGIIESHIKFADSSHTLTVGDCLQIIDSCSSSYNGHIIVLVDNNPQKWQDLGLIQGKAGEDGKSSYIHVKWSNNVIPNDEGINTNENATFTGNNGEDPGTYRGEYVDSNPNDSTNINDYKWVRAKGQDGFSYWFFYTATDTNEKPTGIPTINSASDLQEATLTASNGTIWYDEIPTNTSIYDPETQYLWQIWVRDDQADLTFKGPILYAAPSSDGVAYNIVINNTGILWDSLAKTLTGNSSNKNLQIIVYKNEEQLDFNIYTEYTLTAFVTNSDTSTQSSVKIADNSIITYNNLNSVIKNPSIQFYLKKSNQLVFQYQYNIPIAGIVGPQGAPGTPADTGITILLSNDVAHLPCNPDNSPISIAQVQTNIEVFKGDTNITDYVALGSDSNTQNSVSTSQSGFSYDYSAVRNRISYSNKKYTLTSKLISTDNNYQYLVPIYIRYNDYVYTKYFTIRKDYTGDVYELIVTPQVYTDKDSNKTLDIKVNRTYSRTGHTTGVITSTLDSEYDNLKITINNGNKQSIIGYTTTKLNQASFDVKLFENNNLIDEEVVTRVVGTQGAQGIQGCVLRNRGYWSNTISDYVNEGEYTPQSATEVRYIDYVFLKNTDKCYRVKYASQIPSHSGVTNGKVIVPVGDNYKPNTSEYWVEASSQEFAYIKDLIAQNIAAQTVSADEFLVKRKLLNGSTQIVGGMVKGDTNTTKIEENVVFFAGTSADNTTNLNTKEAKTYITEGGKLHSQNAEIIGSVTANELIVSDQSNKNKPSIIFTTYGPNNIINTYNSDGTIATSDTMSNFNNLLDSNNKKFESGSPIGIVYRFTNDQYVPSYFFDFAPLKVDSYKINSVYYNNYWGSNNWLWQDQNNLLYSGNSTSDLKLYTGYVYQPFNGEMFEYESTRGINILHHGIGYRKLQVTNGVVNNTTIDIAIKFDYTYNYVGLSTIDEERPVYERISTSNAVSSIHGTLDIKGKYNTNITYPESSIDYNQQRFMGNNYGLIKYTYQDLPTNKNNLYEAVPLSKGGIFTEQIPRPNAPELCVLNDNYITNTSDKILSFTTANSSSYSVIDRSKISGFIYTDRFTTDNSIIATDLYSGVKGYGYNVDMIQSTIGTQN